MCSLYTNKIKCLKNIMTSCVDMIRTLFGNTSDNLCNFVMYVAYRGFVIFSLFIFENTLYAWKLIYCGNRPMIVGSLGLGVSNKFKIL